MNKSEIQRLLKEKERRDKLKAYKEDFALFAQEQVKIITKDANQGFIPFALNECCLLYTSPSPRDRTRSRMPSSA